MAERFRFTRVSDPKTGEIVQEIRETFHSSEWFKPKQGYKLYGRGRPKLGKYSLASLTDSEAGFLIRLTSFVDKDNRIPHIDRLTKQMARDKRQLYRLLSRLAAAGLIAKYEGSYYLNPAFMFMGIYLPFDLYDLFREDLSKFVPAWVEQLYLNDRS